MGPADKTSRPFIQTTLWSPDDKREAVRTHVVVEWLERLANDQEALGSIPVNSNIILEKQPFYGQYTVNIEWR